MGDTRNQLIQAALQIGSHHKLREARALEEKNRLRFEILQQEEEAEAASLAFKRGLNFGKALGADLICPNCWVARGTRVELTPVASESDDVDEFRCRACHEEYSFPA